MLYACFYNYIAIFREKLTKLSKQLGFHCYIDSMNQFFIHKKVYNVALPTPLGMSKTELLLLMMILNYVLRHVRIAAEAGLQVSL